MNYATAAKNVNNTIITRLVDGNLRVENGIIIYPNFAGRPTNLNPAGGKRTFSLCLPKDWADILKSDGWNVKERVLDEGDVLYHTEIVVNENSQYPPHLFINTEFNGKKTLVPLAPAQFNKLDDEVIVYIDLEIHPFQHDRGAIGAKKGYLKNLWATTQSVNDFGGKYADYNVAGVVTE